MSSNKRRVFLIVLDSMGIGEMPDSREYGDQGSNTLAACWSTGHLEVPNLERMGLFNIQGVGCGKPAEHPAASFARLAESSRGKDTTIGHWEIAGVISHQPLPTFPHGFPQEIIEKFSHATGRRILCNKPYSGTQALLDYGREHMETGALIVYTSADSVFQVAAHEEIVPVSELYHYCEIARKILTGPYGVGRVIARPFVGKYPHYTRTANRHDFSLEPTAPTVLDAIAGAGLDSVGVGKISDIFAGRGITQMVRNKSNADGMEHAIHYAGENFHGLCFVNLVDFDMLYGHRNDAEGYTNALNEFDRYLGQLLPLLRPDDLLMITADHGCDPSTPSTDHSREYVPLLIWGANVQKGVDLGTAQGFDHIAATVAEYLEIPYSTQGESFLQKVWAHSPQ